jgi:histidine triad (HIT) family protein
MEKSNSLKTRALTLLLRAARWRLLQPVVRLFFKHMDHFLNLDRLAENTHWVAFHHPDPAYPLHILMVPRRPIPSLTAAPTDTPGLYADLFTLVRCLIHTFDLETRGYRLIINGGPNQTIPQWHCHLISESPPPGDPHA